MVQHWLIDRIRRRCAAGPGAGRRTSALSNRSSISKTMSSRAGRGVRVARLRRAAVRSRRLRLRPDQQGTTSIPRSRRHAASCRCTSAAIACSSPSPTRPTCRRSTRSGSRPTSSSMPSSSRTTSSADDRQGHRVDGPEAQGPGQHRGSRSRTCRRAARSRRPTNRIPDVEDAPVVKYIQKILLDAIGAGVSDIHFEPYEKFYRIRYRLDGILKEVATARRW